MEYKIEVYSHNVFSSFRCNFCRAGTPKNGVTARLLENGEKTGLDDICPQCLDAGPSGAAARMRETSKNLREWADSLERDANNVEGISVENWATSDDCEKLSAVVAEEYEKEVAQFS